MAWQNGMQQNNSWYGGPPYANYYCPPGSGFPNGPPPMPPQGWGAYPPPYNGYPFAQNWPYGAPPNIPAPNFVPASDQGNDKSSVPATTDVNKINPPLPPDPPPGEPPKSADDKGSNDDVKKETTETPSGPKETSSAIKNDDANKEITNVNATFNFDPSQFTVPPPSSNYYTMYPMNPWLNSQGYPNANFNQNPLANVHNTSSAQQANAPIRFSIPNKKGNLASNALQQSQSSPLSDKKELENTNVTNLSNQVYQQESSLSSNDNDKKKKKKNVNNNNAASNNSKQPWGKSENLPLQGFTPIKNVDIKNTPPPHSPSNFSLEKVKNVCPETVSSSAEWPANLQNYVERCFARCATRFDKDRVEICLKGRLTQAAHNESLWTKNWDEEPLIVVASLNEKKEKDTFPDSGKAFSKKFTGDPSRGFTVIKRSRSRSRSRSSSPYSADGRRRRDRRRHSSSDSEDKGFIGFNARRGRGGQRGRGKKKGKDKGGFFKGAGAENSRFYSKSGSMTLDADLCTDERLEKRAARFANAQRGGRGGGQGHPNKKKKSLNISMTINNAFTVDDENIDWTSMHIVGTSTALEKQYLRLTSAPEPSTIRTLFTLKKSLEHVKRQWKKNKDYFYACNQLKSIRQDLTVQGIRDNFTIEVYETHCRIALEKGDHEEFNQCQTQLKDLYSDRGGTANCLEFAAYRLLYFIFTQNTLDITSMLASLTESDKKNPCIAFALKLRAAWSLANYHQFFKLYRNAPLMAGYLIDWFAKRERERAIKVLIKSYRPGNLCAEFVRTTLALSGEEWESFVDEFKICFTEKSNKFIDCKQTAVTC